MCGESREYQVNAVVLSKGLDQPAFFEILGGGILDIVVQSEDGLLWTVDPRSPHRHELAGDRK
jgi:hypothetical protein